MKRDELIKAIREQQIECFEYVDVLSEDEIEKLLREGTYFYIEENNKILASAYLKPILEDPKIYRVGGLSLDIKNPSFHIKKAIVKLLVHLQIYILNNNNIAFITRSETISIESFCIDIGAKKLSFEECTLEYPLFLKAWLDNSPRTEEYCKSKTFYVREANI